MLNSKKIVLLSIAGGVFAWSLVSLIFGILIWSFENTFGVRALFVKSADTLTWWESLLLGSTIAAWLSVLISLGNVCLDVSDALDGCKENRSITVREAMICLISHLVIGLISVVYATNAMQYL